MMCVEFFLDENISASLGYLIKVSMCINDADQGGMCTSQEKDTIALLCDISLVARIRGYLSSQKREKVDGEDVFTAIEF